MTKMTFQDDLQPSIVQEIKYMKIRDMDMWRIPIIKEAMDIKCGNLNPPEGWTREELDEILQLACTE